jgi:hypothetical protein
VVQVFHIGEGTHFWGCIAGFWPCFILGGDIDANARTYKHLRAWCIFVRIIFNFLRKTPFIICIPVASMDPSDLALPHPRNLVVIAHRTYKSLGSLVHFVRLKTAIASRIEQNQPPKMTYSFFRIQLYLPCTPPGP